MIGRSDSSLPTWWPWFLVGMATSSFALAALIG
jgi:hypothetical protein